MNSLDHVNFESRCCLLENTNLLPLSDTEVENIRSLRTKRLTIVICGQNVLAQSIIANELLSKQVLPFQVDNVANEKWRIVKIKVNLIQY